MKISFAFLCSRSLWVAFFLALSWPVCGELAQGQRGIVATVHPLATEAGLEAFRRGGNAIDAAIAVGLTLGVVDGHNSGIGGGCLILIRLANGRTIAIDGREVAPLAAYRNMFVRAGRVEPQLSQAGALAAGVPGALAAYNLANASFGKLPLRDHLNYAAHIAETGFTIDDSYARRLQSAAPELNLFEASRAIFLHADGSPKKSGEVLKQTDLANTYRAIANQGISWFYYGPFAVMTADWMARNGGLITSADFVLYQTIFREPLVTTYRDCTILGFPPPSSGGVHVAQILNMVEKFDLKKTGPQSADTIHIIAEAMKLAFADRAFWLGDPDYVKVPRNLVSKAYAAALAKVIDTNRVTAVLRNSIPAAAEQDFFGKHTTHFSTADAAGNWVACTATINTTFGSKVVVPGTGVVLNNEMDDFAAQPGVANYFGLVGAEANSIAPRKRPLSSMSPTIVLRGRNPIMALGAAGGPTIISQVLLALINVIDFEMPLDAALSQPRFHHQWRPDELRMESTIGEAVQRELEKRGHKIAVIPSIGVTQAVGVNIGRTNFVGSHDPRVNGKAAGW
jgi:gamma-glutamyltranspeptidase / glutathione hydrolase